MEERDSNGFRRSGRQSDSLSEAKCPITGRHYANMLQLKDTTYTRAVRKVSVHFEYHENRSRGVDIIWQPVRGDLTAQT